MHTLVVTNDFPPTLGGIETFVAELVGRFPPAEVTVLASTRAPFSAQQVARADSKLPYQVVRHPSRVLWPTQSVARFAADVARDVRADAVWFGAAAPFGLIAAGLRRRVDLGRIVATTHGHEVWWAAFPGTRQALRRIGDGVDVVTYLTDYTGRRIAPALSPPARRRMVKLSPAVTAFAPIPADAAPQFPDAAASAGASGRAALDHKGEAVVLCVSRLVPRKGQDQLIRGWPSVAAAHREAKLVIVGAGSYEPKLRRMAAASPAAGSIALVGKAPYERLAEFYQAARVFAMPCRSRWLGLEVEGLGIVYLEAQAAGLPVVAGDSGGAPDAVLEGQTGFVVDGRDWRAAAAKIIELLDDPVRAAAMGAAGRDWVRREWDWQSRYDTLAALLHPPRGGSHPGQ
ncbi:MAG: glycosyltransferase family 4 protein [Bifidobacteriaceae bacterium]|jgi:phosphatidylinositol alpha-1,6-mannosyltransferase|nr:glycosyltransferase family 4 protein [Bifidobacteriaceae bacterium]